MAETVTITVNGTPLICPSGANLLGALLDGGYSVYAPCAGTGKCLKCRVRVDPAPPIDETEVAKIGAAEAASGVRLACRTMPTDGMKVEILAYTRSKSVLRFIRHRERYEGRVSVAVDLGSTTIISQFVGEDGEPIVTVEIENPQKRFGADIIKRIEFSLARPDGGTIMRSLTLAAIGDGIFDFLALTGIPKDRIASIAIAGNTTMEHILLGLPLGTISLPPFTPYSVDSRSAPSQEIGLPLDDIPTYVFPVAGSFIGGDTVAGAMAILATYGDIEKLSADNILIIDIGTNTEIVLVTGKRIFATSTPAGPAFEGGAISHGMRAYEGAIAAVTLDADTMKITLGTIADGRPEGICGSGIFDLVAAMIESGVIGADGRFTDDSVFADRIFETKDEKEFVLYRDAHRVIGFTQGDVREIQLAKGAISAAVSILCTRANIDEQEIKRIVLLGNFGSRVTRRHLQSLGIVNDIHNAEVVTIPDGVVAGVRATLHNHDARARIERLARTIEVVQLSGDATFEKAFLGRLNFR